MLFAVPAAAQKPGQTATQFYNEYRTAWVHSKSMDTLLPYISKESRTQYETTPKEQNKQQKNNNTSGEPEQKQERNYSQGENQPVLAFIPNDPPVETVTTYRRIS